MPELPEVETIRRSLTPYIVGKRIADVEVYERRFRQRIQRDLEARLRGRSFRRIERRGKYLLFVLDDRQCLLLHLGMSGSLEIRRARDPVVRHDHVRVRLDGRRVLVFNDPRRFGLLRVGNRRELHELDRVGLDPLDDDWSAEQLRRLARGRRRPIKNVLMDQRLLAGIGNIYANEILYQAGIRPTRRAGSLRRRELEALATATVTVLGRAVDLGGSSISDYVDGEGQPGNFQLHFAVYDRYRQPCQQCATPIRRIVLGGRSTFYCPRCQR